jgi:uracil-DNA glycosylase
MSSQNDNILHRVEKYLLQQTQLYGSFTLNLNAVDSELDASQGTPVLVDKSPPEVETVHEEQHDRNTDDLPQKKSDETYDPKVMGMNSMLEILQRDPKLNEIHSLTELEAYCNTLDFLKTDLADTRLVFGKGNPHADLMLIGEAPGAEEDKLGEPFVGRSGQLLTKILQAINFSREDVYIANILKHRPPDNRNPLPEERERSLPYLLKQIELISPKLILCLGKVPTDSLLQTKGSLTSLRGRFHPFMDRYEVLLTYHPAYLLRDPNKKKDTWEDVKLLRKRYDELNCKP